MKFHISLLLFIGVVNSMMTSIWRATYGDVTAWEAEFSLRSRIECSLQCKRSPLCASFAFVAGTRKCYLHPTTSAALNQENATSVYIARDPLCDTSDAPAFNNGHLTSLSRTLTSVEANVTCHDDYLFDGSIWTAVCDTSGLWDMSGVTGACKQRTWRDGTAVANTKYFLPKTPSAGWTVCLTGVPTGNRFSVDLNEDGDYILVTMDNWINYSGKTNDTYLDYYHGSWGNNWKAVMDYRPYPFVIGLPFSLRMTSPDGADIQIYVNNLLYTTYPAPVTIDNLKSVQCHRDLQILYLNVWCT